MATPVWIIAEPTESAPLTHKSTHSNMKTSLASVVLVFSLIGCATPSSVNTASGRPEVTISSDGSRERSAL